MHATILLRVQLLPYETLPERFYDEKYNSFKTNRKKSAASNFMSIKPFNLHKLSKRVNELKMMDFLLRPL